MNEAERDNEAELEAQGLKPEGCDCFLTAGERGPNCTYHRKKATPREIPGLDKFMKNVYRPRD